MWNVCNIFIIRTIWTTIERATGLEWLWHIWPLKRFCSSCQSCFPVWTYWTAAHNVVSALPATPKKAPHAAVQMTISSTNLFKKHEMIQHPMTALMWKTVMTGACKAMKDMKTLHCARCGQFQKDKSSRIYAYSKTKICPLSSKFKSAFDKCKNFFLLFSLVSQLRKLSLILVSNLKKSLVYLQE